MSWLITINDTHKTDGQVENSELETVAEVSGSRDDYRIDYNEQSEEMKGCQTSIHVTDGCRVHITRKGSYNTELRMDRGKRNQCSYVTPVGQISMGVYTSRVISEFNEDSIKLDFTYTLDFNNELLSRNRVRISGTKKEAE